MTRINLVPPHELTDQHLFAEFREIKMIPKSLARSVIAAKRKWGDQWEEKLLDSVPKEFTLGKGHVTFFYNKYAYLWYRYSQIRSELAKRGINFNRESALDSSYVYHILSKRFDTTYVPTNEALNLVRERIAQRISLKPDWYRYPK